MIAEAQCRLGPPYNVAIMDRITNLEVTAYGEARPVGAILAAMTDEEIVSTLEPVLEDQLQDGRHVWERVDEWESR